MTVRRRGEGEDGATLMLALAFLLLFSLVIAAVLAHEQTGLQTTNAVKAHGSKLYAADGGIDFGIQKPRCTDSRSAPTSQSADVACRRRRVERPDRARHLQDTPATTAPALVFGPSGWTTVATGCGAAASNRPRRGAGA